MTSPGHLLKFILLFIISYRTSTTSASLSDQFDPRGATIPSIHHALLLTKQATCREIVSAFLSRIETLNPSINAIISLNPETLTIADQIDNNQISTGNNMSTTQKLLCIPVLLKDNFDAIPMATTGGSLSLANNYPANDAPTVQALKTSGAIILGKTNLHEMALEGLTVSSLGGQTINPFDFTRTPGGSSGGSGAAVAAGFALLATGTDTMNSLRSPASANGLFSFRPSKGLILREGVIPVSETQDAVGAMAWDLGDLRVAFEVMASTAEDGAAEFDDDSMVAGKKKLSEMRFGVVDGFFNHTASGETTPVNDLMKGMLAALERSGVGIVNITEAVYNIDDLLALDVQMYEFRELLDEYLGRPNVENGEYRPSHFEELYDPEKERFLVIPRHYENIRKALVSSTREPDYADRKQKITELTKTLEDTFLRNDLDALIYPEQKNLVVKIGSESQHGRNGILAALTGSPVVTVPVGFSPATEDAPLGVPVGMEILSRPGSDMMLLKLAQDVYDEVGIVGPGERRIPAWADVFVEPKIYEKVPDIRPNRENIPLEYPLNVF
ncbi:amidase signature domain-containing protein [Rhypophila decipiens]|uniref:Amidase signature domain-containing protein n=1 Tax=Rhypophila decipiens TaxID=261697 RepID=A0AAN6YA11_9PEZI|nr:amidase signature domain-containing protein [Rhypophila decipiens]